MNNYLFSKLRAGIQKYREQQIGQSRKSSHSQTGFFSSHGLVLSVI